jgi:hypothetical protein
MDTPKAHSMNVTDLHLRLFFRDCTRVLSARRLVCPCSPPTIQREACSTRRARAKNLLDRLEVLFLSRSLCSPLLNQQRMNTTGPTKLTSLAFPIMFNDASWKVSGHEWFCGRQAAVWTTFVAAVCRRVIGRGSGRSFETMPPSPFRASMKF